VAFFELRTFLTRPGVMGDMSKACPNLSSEIGEPAQMALLEPNQNLVLFRVVPICNFNWELG
jgi:hypothetical protein